MLFDLAILMLIAMLALAVWSKNLLTAAIALAGASIIASSIFYLLGAVWIAVFELTVVAGLITVLFVSTISLTKDIQEDIEHPRLRRYLPLALALGVFIAILAAFDLSMIMPDKPLQTKYIVDNFRELLWGQRTMDIIGQMAVILGGIFGIATFFRKIKAPQDSQQPNTPTPEQKED
jgi:NADH-quinone oxidoreductase subunit J